LAPKTAPGCAKKWTIATNCDCRRRQRFDRARGLRGLRIFASGASNPIVGGVSDADPARSTSYGD
jgi:hypothetical protein